MKEEFKRSCAVLLVVVIICAMAIGLILGFILLLSLFLPQLIALICGFVLEIFIFTFGMILLNQKYGEAD